jgi:hypothetical protein
MSDTVGAIRSLEIYFFFFLFLSNGPIMFRLVGITDQGTRLDPLNGAIDVAHYALIHGRLIYTERDTSIFSLTSKPGFVF